MARTVIGNLKVPWSDEYLKRLALEQAKRDQELCDLFADKKIAGPKKRPHARRS